MKQQNEELRQIVNAFHELNLRLGAWREKYEKREILVSVIPAEKPGTDNFPFDAYDNGESDG